MRATATANSFSYIASRDIRSNNLNVDYLSHGLVEIFRDISKIMLKPVEAAASIGAPAYPSQRTLTSDSIQRYSQFFSGLHSLYVEDADSEVRFKKWIDPAVNGMLELIAAGILPPLPMVQDDGTIGAFWRNGKTYASIDFYDDGERPWIASEGERYVSGMWQIGTQIPAELARVLRKLDV